MATPYDPNDSTSGATPFLEWMQAQGLNPADLTDEELGSWFPQWQMSQQGPDPNRVRTDTGTGDTGSGDTGGGGTGGGGSSLGGGGTPYDSSGFLFPQFQAPRYGSPAPFAAPPPFSYEGFTGPDDFSFAAYAAPEPFSYGEFKPPTAEDAANEPGYAFARDEALKALETSAAHAGTLRSGGAQKGLASWTNQFAEQNYGNVMNRAANVYNTNRGNAFENYALNSTNALNAYGTNRNNAIENYSLNRNNAFQDYTTNRANAADAYLTNYGISRDMWNMNTDEGRQAYDRNFNAAAAEFNPQFQASQLKFADLFNRYNTNLNALTTTAGYGAI